MNDLTLYFSEFDIPGNHALGLYRALAACRERGARRLLFDVPGVYELDPSFCAERELCISNHGFNGPHRIAVLIENMEDFEIDFGGSRLILPGEATHIAILSSRRVAVRNVTLEDPQCMAMQVRVVAHGDGYVDTEIMQGGEQFDVRRGELTCPKPRRSCNYGVELDVELVGDTGEYMPGTADHNFGAVSAIWCANISPTDGCASTVCAATRLSGIFWSFPPRGAWARGYSAVTRRMSPAAT